MDVEVGGDRGELVVENMAIRSVLLYPREPCGSLSQGMFNKASMDNAARIDASWRRFSAPVSLPDTGGFRSRSGHNLGPRRLTPFG